MKIEPTLHTNHVQTPVHLVSFFETLGIDRAKSDSERAQVLSMLAWFSNKVDDPELAAAALALMPAADPFRPSQEWRARYNDAFSSFADEDRGTYLDDMPRYGVEYWQALTDAQRLERLSDPSIGSQDGEKDAENLNCCTDDVASITAAPEAT
jgi:hypothetical protein